MFPFVDAELLETVLQSTMASGTPSQGRGQTKRTDTVVEQATLALFRVRCVSATRRNPRRALGALV